MPKHNAGDETGQPSEGVRLNKFLASCGIASRRKCEVFIQEGHVEVNAKVVIDLATRILPTDHVRFDGRLLHQASELTLILNKPKGYVCTRDDPEGRSTVFELLPKKFQHINYVGRLDLQSEGLLIFTNSGELNERLTHPRFHVEKEYEVYLDRAFDTSLSRELISGIHLHEGTAKAESVKFFTRKRGRIVLAQGFNRQVRRMFSQLGYKVRELERVRIGSFTDLDLRIGDYRPMNSKEIREAGENPVR